MTDDLTVLVDRFLAERRRLGFLLTSCAYSLRSFAKHVRTSGHRGSLTVEVMARWAREDSRRSNRPRAWAYRLRQLRSFARWLRQFDPRTEVPDDSTFGRRQARGTPHIYSERELEHLLAAARQLDNQVGLRGPVYETLFGLIASTGLRVSEAVALHVGDMDLAHGVLTIRRTKFGKSRAVPLHPSATRALIQYHAKRDQAGASSSTDEPFFIGTRVDLFGKPLGAHQVRCVFAQIRRDLGWVNRGSHHAPRVHDLRHYSESRNMPSRQYRRGRTARGSAGSALGIFLPATHRGVTGDDDGTHIGDSGGCGGRGLVAGAGCALW